MQVNQQVAMSTFKAFDVGGSITIHAFGAYYGLSASLMLSRQGLMQLSAKANMIPWTPAPYPMRMKHANIKFLRPWLRQLCRHLGRLLTIRSHHAGQETHALHVSQHEERWIVHVGLVRHARHAVPVDLLVRALHSNSSNHDVFLSTVVT